MTLSLRARIQEALGLPECNDDEIMNVIDSVKDRDRLAAFRQGVVDAMPFADAQSSDENLVSQVRCMHSMRQDERARLAKDIYLRTIATSTGASGRTGISAIYEEEAVRRADALLAALEHGPQPRRAEPDLIVIGLRAMLERMTECFERAVLDAVGDGILAPQLLTADRALIAEARALLAEVQP